MKNFIIKSILYVAFILAMSLLVSGCGGMALSVYLGVAMAIFLHKGLEGIEKFMDNKVKIDKENKREKGE